MSFRMSPNGVLHAESTDITQATSAYLTHVESVESNRPVKYRIPLRVYYNIAREFRGLPPLTQTVGAHLLRQRGLTQEQAAAMFRCRSLSSRISELRRVGFLISKIRCYDNFGQLYVTYAFEGFNTDE